ncbi:hypothetical protein WUBG_00073 [Wuchereria bancrofti]|uniref:Uncharacterized protein n=1 Tax=Wuchereria bancrofti TaxID=6293 RepID=J9FNP1_WUCBA|nr:hypothetical protein WUBG_00073 [Wuchereria bancrofti]
MQFSLYCNPEHTSCLKDMWFILGRCQILQVKVENIAFVLFPLNSRDFEQILFIECGQSLLIGQNQQTSFRQSQVILFGRQWGFESVLAVLLNKRHTSDKVNPSFQSK